MARSPHNPDASADQRVQDRAWRRPIVFLADVATFVACAGAILASGTRLVRHADHLATLTGLGGTRIGVLLLATATSVPEIVAATTAASLALPNLAVGNLLGTLPLNLSVLAVAQLALRRPGLVATAAVRHPRMLWACFLTAAAAGGLIVLGGAVPLVAGIGIGAPLLVAGYAFVAMQPARSEPDESVSAEGPGMTARQTLAWFAFHVVIVGVAATLLPGRAAGIADTTGLARAFVGTVFLAVATTLPELAVAFAAVRLGARDLAVGNAFGSLLFNLALLGILDIAYGPGSLVADVDPTHAITVIGALAMMASLALVARGRSDADWPAGALLAIHVLTLVLLFWASGAFATS